MRSIVVATLALVALSSAAARADWEYTRWGMSPDQVAGASKGAVKVLPPDKRRKVEEANMEGGAEGSYADGPLKLRVGFSFDMRKGGLVCVSYAVQDKAQNPLLKDWLIRRYGEPQNTSELAAIGLQSLSWSEPDDISLEMMRDEAAFVLHCATRS
jgi:hypothetical protein